RDDGPGGQAQRRGHRIMPPRMQDKYRDEVVQRLREHYQYANIMQVPKIEKIVVNIGMGEALTDANALDRAADDVGSITGQKPIINRASARSPTFACAKATRSASRRRCAVAACTNSWTA